MKSVISITTRNLIKAQPEKVPIQLIVFSDTEPVGMSLVKLFLGYNGIYL
ncbi:hypothetical protein [Solitalea canadensis]|nr:hypothetical protein [Solitalea canadensis]